MPRHALRSYPTKDATDLTDEQWAALAPLVVTPSPNGGRPTDIDRRAIVNALLSKHRTGCQWRMLPADVPPMRFVRSSFDTWNRDGTFVKIIIEKPPGQTGCAVIPKRWLVERSIAWAGRHRLARKADNRTPESSEAFLYPGLIAMLLNRLYPRCSFLITLLDRLLSRIIPQIIQV